MKSSTHFGTQPSELAPHAASDGAGDAPSCAGGVDPGSAFEPVRLLAGGGSAFEQQLLGSARVDHMPATSRQHLARALNVPGAAAPGALVQRLLRSSRLGKYGSLVGVGACALLAAWAVRRWPAETPVEPTRQSVILAAPPIAEAGRGDPLAPGLTEAEVAADRENENPEAAAPSPPVASGTRSQSRMRVRPAPSPRADVRDGLREELSALEAVQRSVRAGRTSEAQHGLEAYAHRFPEGELRLEAELLSLDVSLARGDAKQTHERARELLKRPDAARYRERLEALSRAAGDSHDATLRGSESPSSPHRTGGGH